jgi:acetyltransferase-like isoleucine patch superfamily enzyme
MFYTNFKQRIRNKIDRLFHIDRRSEYGFMAKDAYLAPDVMVFSKKNLYLYENTSIPEGSLILNPRSKFIMKRGSFSSYNLCVCPGNHMPLVGVWKHDVTDAIKDELDKEGKYDRDIIVEEDVWMGINVTLLNGTHIGRGCIVGAGCVVSGEWPPYSVIVGNPARIIKSVFSLEDIVRHEEKLYSPEDRIPKEVLIEIFREYHIQK